MKSALALKVCTSPAQAVQIQQSKLTRRRPSFSTTRSSGAVNY